MNSRLLIIALISGIVTGGALIGYMFLTENLQSALIGISEQ